MIDEVLGALELFAPGVDVQDAWHDSDKRLSLVLMMIGIGVAAFTGAKLRAGLAPSAESTLKEVEDDVSQD